jgi:hypothetical protein
VVYRVVHGVELAVAAADDHHLVARKMFTCKQRQLRPPNLNLAR